MRFSKHALAEYLADCDTSSQHDFYAMTGNNHRSSVGWAQIDESLEHDRKVKAAIAYGKMQIIERLWGRFNLSSTGFYLIEEDCSRGRADEH